MQFDNDKTDNDVTVACKICKTESLLNELPAMIDKGIANFPCPCCAAIIKVPVKIFGGEYENLQPTIAA